MKRVDLRCLPPEALHEELVTSLGEKPFRARQIHRWLHKNCAASFSEMTDLSKDLRRRLEERYVLETLDIHTASQSGDGTVKLALRTTDSFLIETVYIPEWKNRTCDDFALERPPDRSTLCISTQVGCGMGCAFCKTATMGLVRNMSVGEIVDQVYRTCAWLRHERQIDDSRPISNLVFMGMGEPLANYENVKAAIDILLSPDGMDFSHRHVTVSTCGLIPALERLGAETNVKVAISLTGTTEETRNSLMPVNRKWPIAQLLETCRKLPIKRGRRITFEYVMLAGVTDSLEDANRLAKILADVPAKINLIAYNESDGLPFKRPDEEQVLAFRETLASRGLTVMVRRSRGGDISAACGQLAIEQGKARG